LGLSQAQLSRILFPIGHLWKKEVRVLAQKFDLPNKDRKDSQGICFLGKIKHPDFVKFHLGEKIGDIIELESGAVLGQHRGFWFYTIGQRQGLGLSGGPWYVVKKDTGNNIVYVSHKDYYDWCARNQFTVADVNWISGKSEKHELHVKIRHGPYLNDCAIETIDEKLLAVRISTKDSGIAPGQFAVFYDGGICLGGGVIE
jgi:tRNA-specific 2-thiouridylase